MYDFVVEIDFTIRLSLISFRIRIYVNWICININQVSLNINLFDTFKSQILINIITKSLNLIEVTIYKSAKRKYPFTFTNLNFR